MIRSYCSCNAFIALIVLTEIYFASYSELVALSDAVYVSVKQFEIYILFVLPSMSEINAKIATFFSTFVFFIQGSSNIASPANAYHAFMVPMECVTQHLHKYSGPFEITTGRDYLENSAIYPVHGRDSRERLTDNT